MLGKQMLVGNLDLKVIKQEILLYHKKCFYTHTRLFYSLS